MNQNGKQIVRNVSRRYAHKIKKNYKNSHGVKKKKKNTYV